MPGAVAVVPCLDDEGPGAGAAGGNQALPTIQALPLLALGRVQSHALALPAPRIKQHGGHAQLVMPLAEDGGADHQILTRQRFRRETATLNHRLHGSDGEPPEAKSVGDVRGRLGIQNGGGSRSFRHNHDVSDKNHRMLSKRGFSLTQDDFYLKETQCSSDCHGSPLVWRS